MDKFETENGNEEPIEYHSPDLSSQWQRFSGPNLTNTTMGLSNPMVMCKGDLLESSSCSSASMVDSFCPPIWDHPTNSQNLGISNALAFRKSNFVLPRIDMSWAPVNSSIPKEALLLPATSPHGILSQTFSHCPTDSGFIERAARFSSFSGGNFGDMMNPFCIPESISPPYSSRPQEVFGFPCGQFGKNEMVIGGSKNEAKLGGVGGSSNESDGDDFSGAGAGGGSGGCGEGQSLLTNKGQGSKKRKRSGQDNENDEAKLGALKGTLEAKIDTKEIQQKGDKKKPNGKQIKEGNQGTDAVKEEYIHVRARRGQATNSHSLAERVRREKISERMKFLQDLVPGCSKVTGKAVMLDEIINYVQSLQRQVEFLSMKLATVNPRLEFNIEGLLAKDMIHSRVGPSSSHGFPPDMSMPPPYPPLHPSSQPGLNQLMHPMGVDSSSDSLRGTIMNAGFKEPASQVSSVWEDELHNIVQMGFNSSATLDSQE